MSKQLFSVLKITTIALVLSSGLSYVYAWTAPASNPPTGNVSAPINTSGTAQTKAGDLTVGRLCLTGVCNASWPLGGTTNNYYSTPTYNYTYPTAGVTSLSAGTGISLSGNTGAVTVSATGGGGGGVATPPVCTGANVLHWNGSSWTCDVAGTFTNTTSRVVEQMLTNPTPGNHYISCAADEAITSCTYQVSKCSGVPTISGKSCGSYFSSCSFGSAGAPYIALHITCVK